MVRWQRHLQRLLSYQPKWIKDDDFLLVQGMDSTSTNSNLKDVRDALSGLGYGADEIQLAMKGLPSDTEAPLLLKLALQELANV